MESKRTKVVFMGYSVGGAHTLETLLDLEADVVGIVVPASAPPEKNEEVIRLAGDIPVLYSDKPDAAAMETVRLWEPDLVVVYSFPYLLPPVFLEIPSRGCINLHGAYLPSYRGAHVLQWAIINGEKETGITLHHIDAGMDTGDIIDQVKVPIQYEDTALTLREHMYAAGDELLKEMWPLIEAGTAPRIPQDHGSASVFHKRSEKDGRIDWKKSSFEIYNLVRALLYPWPGAFTAVAGRPLRIYRAEEKVGSLTAIPGQVLCVFRLCCEIQCGKGSIVIRQADFESKPVADFRHIFKKGEILA